MVKKIINKIKDIGIVNTVIIIVFIIGVLYFLASLISYIDNDFYNNSDIEIYYDYNNKDAYSIDNENENYRYSLVTNYTTFYNVENIIKNIFNNIINVFSDDMKKYYNLNNDEFISKMIEMFNDFVFDNSNLNNVYLYELYNIENTNIYVCNVRNSIEQQKRIVLNINFQTNTYIIEDIDF